ncbi:hypothetical protein DTO013E5_2497 [Penicillium roqueforti]|uniref:Genomic scaffold, ProqFM164S02 n=1 Tax=Penicillium roqueforti (strain FM164) TaxID=1365484 RepID=W6Q3L5_PENRF|nr:uncharacterized protein LCP9604111_7760 [Penicillium roqueforti]XP_057044089.1 uncharacterized protein N7518_001711 [Penicillium psychrosexuale]CDM30556.1 unnamed protein product [Penicillium roqueforti FM164]KAF9242964.1 hypothetical protein LCP9604111_7760 [Penicillium roqueforti]KAI1838338.1 hypothetical protein CBS147337_63 [Penicillium roqueforti]KAI2680729.1 hypothetical protein CBS147355_3709 [Penicillium roqueforti]KAI2690881.1 hypothetical protein LCP963914a_1082 [Penicillium roqu
MSPSQPGSAEKTIRKIDIAQVSLSLQDRLGLAKLKYQHGRLHGLNPHQHDGRPVLETDKPSDSSSEFSRSRCETPFTSPPLQASTYSKELPRSARNKHAATFNSRVMQPMLTASRKRLRSDSDSERPAKVHRVSWKSSHRLPESSPGMNRHRPSRRTQLPFMSEAIIPEVSSPVYPRPSEEIDPDLPVHSFQHISSVIGSSPPRTPPPKHMRLSRNNQPQNHEDGADLLLYLANSPTPARVARGNGNLAFPPSTPPSQHALLPGMTPTLGAGMFANISTPNQQFNFADFVNVTPSPAQPTWSSRTPGNPARTPLTSSRKRLNFDALVPPSNSSPRLRSKETGLALQLGGELHP